MIKRCYPNGKRKAFNVTYDDGVLQDVRLVQLLNSYGIKGTFNLNSGLMEQEFEWVHPNGMTVKRLSREAVTGLYDGHEIASHSLTHPYMSSLSRQEVLHEMSRDKENLERLFGREVWGFALPFRYYSDMIAQCARETGFRYARISEFKNDYHPWQDRYYWKCGFYHIEPGLWEYVEGFLQTHEELALCQIIGHSYDLDAEDLWDVTEKIFASVSGCKDIWFATNHQIVDYLMAMSRLQITNGGAVNHSDADLWLEVDGKTICLHPGESVKEENV
jgi:hypothetical protein